MLPRYPLVAAAAFALLSAPVSADTSRGVNAQALVIEREHIQQMPARNLVDVLDTVGGIHFQRFYGLGDSANSSTHFGATSMPLIMLNGRRMDFSQGNARGVNSIPLAIVERIEVLPFTGAVLYGQGAQGAAINIVTRTAQQDEAQITLEGGSFNTRKGSIWASTRRNNTALFSAAEINASRGYRHANDVRQHNGFLDLRHDLGASSLYLNFHGSSEKLDIPGALPTSVANPKQSQPQAGEQKRDTFHLMPGVVWHFEHVDAFLEGSTFSRQEEYADFANNRFYDMEVKGYGVNPRLVGEVNTGVLAHRWTLGGDIYEVRYQDDGAFTRAKAEQHQAGVYGQLRTQYTPWFATTLGARHEQVRQQDWQGQRQEREDVAQYEGALEFQLAPPLRFTLTAARAEQAADVLQQSAGPLAPEIGQLYSGTLAWQHQGQSSAISYWYGEQGHQWFYDPAAQRLSNRDDKVRHSGFSVNSRWQLDTDVWLTLNATVQKNTFKEGQWEGAKVPNAPRRTGYAQVNWRAFEWLDVAFAQRYYGTRYYAFDETRQAGSQRGYNWSDLTATARWQQFDFTVGVYNLQDRKAYDVGFVDASGNNNETARYPLPGRHVMASISAKL